MLTSRIIAGAAALFVATPVFAQDLQTDPLETLPDPMKTEQGETTAPEAVPASPDTAQSAPATPQAEGGFVAAQAEGQWLADDLIGRTVVSADGQTVGEIDNLILGQDGRVNGVTLSVGGFLGMGDRTIAVPFDVLQQATDANGVEVLALPMNAEAVETAPEFVSLETAQRLEEQQRATQESQQMEDGLGTNALEPAN